MSDSVSQSVSQSVPTAAVLMLVPTHGGGCYRRVKWPLA